MVITTQYDVGNALFFMWSNKIEVGNVNAIQIHMGKSTEIYYHLSFADSNEKKTAVIKEGNCFLTKEQLINTL